MINQPKVRRIARLAVVCALGATIARVPLCAQEAQHPASWIMEGCKALLADPSIAGEPGATPRNAQQSMQIQAATCLSNIQTLMTVGGLGGKFCPPINATSIEAVRAIVAYIQARPGAQPDTFKDLATEALAVQWPCKQ
jgi:hypothetical protein